MLDFALLAPVPADYLEEGCKASRETGYVSFGSQKFEFFRNLDKERGTEKVPALLYASHEDVEIRTDFEVSYIAWYIGSTEDYMEKKSDEANGHRPESALTDYNDKASRWPTFWRVEKLQKIPKNVLIKVTDIQILSTGKPRKNFAPYGPEKVRFNPEWKELLEKQFIDEETPEVDINPFAFKATDTSEPPGRTPVTTQRIIRDTAKSKELKKLYQNACQVCGTQLQVSAHTYYSEVHHLRPLGGDHNGLDIHANMLVLCPNHHALFDYAVPLIHLDHDATIIEFPGEKHRLKMKHPIDQQNILYHNEMVHASRKK